MAVVAFVVCLALTVIGLVSAGPTAGRRGLRAGTRMVALALVPLGAYLAGLVRLGLRVGEAAGRWGLSLVFNPLTWAGFGMLALSAVLLLATRGRGRQERVPATPGAASVPRGRRTRTQVTAGSAPVDDFSDVEELLRRRGVR